MCIQNLTKEFTVLMKKSRSNKKSNRKITFQATKQNLSSQVGLIPMIKFAQSLNVSATINSILNHSRGANATYSFGDIVTRSALGISGGARSMCAIARVCSDPVLMQAAAWEQAPDDSTIGRICREATMKDSLLLEGSVHQIRRDAWEYIRSKSPDTKLPGKEMWIDIDSSVKTVFGNQPGAEKGYNSTAKGKKSYHPQIAFCSMTKEILQAWLRCGSSYTGNGIVEFYRQIRAQIDVGTRLVCRNDSGYFNGEFFDECDLNGDGYLVKVKMRGLSSLLSVQKWSAVKDQDGWEQADFNYECGSWSRKRRFVAVRRKREKKKKHLQGELFENIEYDYFCYVTTEDLTPWEAHKSYGQRATCETWIEECKNQTALVGITTKSFWANSTLFQAAVLSYNLFRWMALASGDKNLIRMEPETVRCFMIRVAGKLLTGSRQLRILTPEHRLHPGCWQSWLRAADLTA